MGEVWYNDTDNVLKFQHPNVTNAAGSWRTGGNLNTARVNFAGAAGTNSAALLFGGNTPPSTNKTEAYNGTSWTEVNDLNTARHGNGGAGTSNSSISFWWNYISRRH